MTLVDIIILAVVLGGAAWGTIASRKAKKSGGCTGCCGSCGGCCGKK